MSNRDLLAAIAAAQPGGPAAPDLRALLAAIDRVESSAEELEREIDASDRHVYLAWLRRSIADLRRVAGRQ